MSYLLPAKKYYFGRGDSGVWHSETVLEQCCYFLEKANIIVREPLIITE